MEKMLLLRFPRRAVTPAIATMILLSGTLVLALVVGAYTSGMLAPNVTQVELTSMNVYDGVTSDNVTVSATMSVMFILKNPGNPTNVSSIEFISQSLPSPITSWSISSSPSVGDSFFTYARNVLPGGESASFTLFPVQSTSMQINPGATIDYLIQMSNGQTISGTVVAQ